MTIAKPKSHRKPAPPTRPVVDHKAILARRLDQLADFELHLGHHGAAERLAHRAAELRGAA
jgi:hypothetical protein